MPSRDKYSILFTNAQAKLLQIKDLLNVVRKRLTGTAFEMPEKCGISFHEKLSKVWCFSLDKCFLSKHNNYRKTPQRLMQK